MKKFSGFGYLFREGIKNIWTNRMMSIASVIVLVSCLILTGTAALFSVNISETVKKTGEGNVTRVFLEESVVDGQVIYIEEEIKRIPNVEKTQFISKDEAIKSYQNSMREDIFNQLIGEGNPLPHAIDVTMTDLSLYDQTIEDILKVEGVDDVRDTREVANKLSSLSNLVNTMGLWIVIALVLVSIFIISNTIRMTMYSRRFEISIMKSVGATDSFVRIPFVIEGMFIGLLAGIISSVVTFFLYGAMANVVKSITQINLTPYSQIGWIVNAAFILAGVLIGALGSVLSIGRYLRKEGNELLGW
ncbi:MAG: permease-like cell division protein FtsX [Ruminococcus sp.]